MTPLTLRWRLLLWSSAAAVLTLALVVVLVDISFRGQIRTQLEDGVGFALQIADNSWQSQLGDQMSLAASTALDPFLRAAVETTDAATIQQTLEEVAAPMGGEWSAVVTPDANVIAATELAPLHRIESSHELMDEAREFDIADLWPSEEGLVLVGVSAVMFGTEPLAILVTGQTVGAAQVTALETAAGREAAVISSGVPTLGADAGRLSSGAAAELSEWALGAAPGVEMIELAGERFIAGNTPLLATDGAPVGSTVLLASFDDALAPANTLRAILIAILFLGLALSLAVSGVFARGITVPVGRLLEDTERLARGDLDQPIVPLRDDEIGRLAASFDDMRTSLNDARHELIRVERLGAIGQAASAVAHDFQQPLSTIAGAIGLLRMGGADEPDARDRCYDAIESELDRLGRMKQEIVEFARGESSLERSSIRFDSFIENTISVFKEGLPQKGVTITVEHGFSGEWCIDSYRLGRVIENLIRNAVGAGAKTVSLTTTVEADDLVIRLSDDGSGIPTEMLDDIFEPFVTHGKKEGTGLGLAIARNVVTQHGGSIVVESEPGSTVFTLRMPPMPASASEPSVQSA